VDVLGLTKAALLLDSKLDQSFRPWFFCGFDPTTIAQLLITTSGIPYTRDAYVLDSPRKLPVSHLFSGKDYAGIDLLFIMPIKTGKVTSGLLIIADNPYLSLNQTERDMIFHPIQDLLRQAIQTHHDLCIIPSALEPVLTSDLAGDTELRIQLIQARETGVLIDFAYRDNLSVVLTEFRNLLPDAAYTDLRFRLLSNLQRSIRMCFASPGHDYLWIRTTDSSSIEDLMNLAARDLSMSMVSSAAYSPQIRASLSSVSMDSFLQSAISASAA